MSQHYFYPPSSTNNVTIGAEGATGAPVPSDALLVGGEDPSGNLQALQTDNTGALIVTTGAPTGTQDVNLTQVAGVAVSLGQKVSAASIPAVLSSEQQTILTGIDTSVDAVNTSVIANTAVAQAFSDKTAGALVPEAFDYQDITYVGASTNIDQVVYKLGGSGGTVVATLTLGYDGSNRLNSVTRT